MVHITLQHKGHFMDEQAKVFDRPIVIPYQPPGCLPLYRLLTITGALTCIFVADIHLIVKLVCLVLVVLTCLASARTNWKLPVTFRLDRHDQWTLITRDGETHAAHLISATILLPEFIVLVLGTTGQGKYNVLLTPANTDSTTRRHLRIRLYHPISAGGKGADILSQITGTGSYP